MADLGAYFGNPNLQRQGARGRAQSERRDVNTLADPLTYAIVQGLLGTAPDQMGFSVLNPDYEKIKKVAEPAFALGLLGQAAPALAPLTKGLPVGASIKNIGNDIFKLSKEEFLGSPKITKNSNASDLKPIQLNTLKEVEPQPFMGGKYEFKMNEDGAVVLDKGKPIASYNFGNTLVVDKAHRKSGIAQELVYEWRTTYPAPAKADMRTKASQDIQEKVWDRIQREKEFLPQQEFVYPQKEALEAAQRNAALPVEKGGLGLPKDNTPEMRAEAMGFDKEVLHGTSSDIDKVIVLPEGRRYVKPFYTTADNSQEAAEFASQFANTKSEVGSPRVMPLMIRGDVLDTRNNPEALKKLQDIAEKSYTELKIGEKGLPTWGQVNNYATEAKNAGIDSILLDERSYLNSIANLNPNNIRSRFAAFDPKRRNEADILAGVLPLGLLADEEQRKKLYELMPSLLGQ